MKKIIKKTKKIKEIEMPVDVRVEMPTEAPTAICEECKKVEIGFVGADLGREDLNALAKKINEIITVLNK